MALVTAHAWFGALATAFSTNSYNDAKLEMHVGRGFNGESIIQDFSDWDIIRSLHCAVMYGVFAMNLFLYVATYFKHVSP